MAGKKKPAAPKNAVVSANGTGKTQALTVMEKHKQKVKVSAQAIAKATEECRANPRLAEAMDHVHKHLIVVDGMLPKRLFNLGAFLAQCEDAKDPIEGVTTKISKTVDEQRRPYVGKSVTFYRWLDGATPQEKLATLDALLALKSAKYGAPLTWPHLERLIPVKDWKTVMILVKRIMSEDMGVHELAWVLNGGQAKKTMPAKSKGAGGRPRVRLASDMGRLLKFEKDVNIFGDNAQLQWFDKEYGFVKIAEQTAADAVTPELLAIYDKNIEKARQLREIAETSEESLVKGRTILQQKMALQAKLLGVKDAEVLETKQIEHKPTNTKPADKPAENKAPEAEAPASDDEPDPAPSPPPGYFQDEEEDALTEVTAAE